MELPVSRQESRLHHCLVPSLPGSHRDLDYSAAGYSFSHTPRATLHGGGIGLLISLSWKLSPLYWPSLPLPLNSMLLLYLTLLNSILLFSIVLEVHLAASWHSPPKEWYTSNPTGRLQPPTWEPLVLQCYLIPPVLCPHPVLISCHSQGW